jgi:predicted RNase H-like nuclease (RuvC/YqgF family)
VQALQQADITGTFYLIKDEKQYAKQQQLIAQIQAHEAEITKWKNKMKKETQFNRKVEYNMKIQQLTKQVEQLKQQLQ